MLITNCMGNAFKLNIISQFYFWLTITQAFRVASVIPKSALRASIFFWSTQGFTLGYYMKALRAIANVLMARRAYTCKPRVEPWVDKKNIEARRADLGITESTLQSAIAIQTSYKKLYHLLHYLSIENWRNQRSISDSRGSL